MTEPRRRQFAAAETYDALVAGIFYERERLARRWMRAKSGQERAAAVVAIRRLERRAGLRP